MSKNNNDEKEIKSSEFNNVNCPNCNNLLWAKGLVWLKQDWFCNTCGIEIKNLDFNKFLEVNYGNN